MILPDFLTDELIQKTFKNFFNDDTIEITNVTSKLAVGKGENYTSDLIRSNVTYSTNNNDQKESMSIILKIEQVGTAMEELSKATGMFSKEIEMFSKVLPYMHNIIGSHSLTTFAPTSIYTAELPTPIIMLQDLTPLGYKVGPRKSGLDLEHCRMAMTKIAQFHAVSVIVFERDPSLKEKFVHGIYRDDDHIKPWIMTGCKAFAEYVPKWPGMEKYAEKLKNIEPTVMTRIMDASDSRLGEFNVLNHGDFWVNNMLFQYHDNGKLQDVKFVDFQMSKFSSPAIDLQYFFATSSSEEVREKHMSNLLDVYYSQLLATLSIFGYCLDKVPSRKEFIKDFHSRSFYGLLTTGVVLPLIKSTSREDATFDDYMLDDSEGGFRYECFNNDDYKSYVKILLPLFDKSGVLN